MLFRSLAGDGTDLVHGTTIDADTLVDDDGTHDRLHPPVHEGGDVVALVGVGFGEVLLRGVLDLGDYLRIFTPAKSLRPMSIPV